MTDDPGASDRQSRLDAILEELTARLRRGEDVDIEGFADSHPEFRSEILAFAPLFPVLDQMGRRENEGEVQAIEYRPGDLLNRRYRIIELVGRGGMGEVYRAGDLELGEQVALKFLPERLTSDESALERFRAEVRLARCVSHPNVARVHDILHVDGRPCLSMAYVEGSDVERDLGRFDRYTRDKATKIACEICLGLEAIHECGILHRDIKPANIMIDGQGHVRITDFGLAALRDSPDGKSPAGTPRYLAPELIAGEPASIRSEVYALGLVLYELYTAHRAINGESVEELFAAQRGETPRPPSEFVEGIDADVERVILKCLQKNPEDRPPDVATVRCQLPGGDPIEMALEARETPRPELVARSRPATTLSRRTALLIPVLVAVGLGACLWFGRWVQPTGLVDRPKTPDVLRERAWEVLALIGYDEEYRDSSSAFRIDTSHCQHVCGWEAFAQEKPTPILFDYAQSPNPLPVPENPALNRYTDAPPHQPLPGEVRVVLDSDGTLRSVTVAPSDEPGESAAEPEWAALFAIAGLDFGEFEASTRSDSILVWNQRGTGREDGPHVEAGLHAGRAIYFAVHYPWEEAPPSAPSDSSWAILRWMNDNWALIRGTFINWLLFSMIALSAYIARRNFLLGRADQRGAIVVGALVTLMTLLRWLFMGHKSPLGMATWYGFVQGAGASVIYGGICALFYLATEPLFRRFWPRALVTWVRASRGRLRDPGVGRDLVLGVLVGLSTTLLTMICYRSGIIAGRPDEWSAMWLGHPFSPEVASLGGPWAVLSSPILAVDYALWGGMLTIALLAFLRVILAPVSKRAIVAVALFAALNVTMNLPDQFTIPGCIAVFLIMLGLAWIITHVGVLVHVVGLFIYSVLRFLPLTTDIYERRFWGTGVALAIVVGLTIYGTWRAFAPAVRVHRG